MKVNNRFFKITRICCVHTTLPRGAICTRSARAFILVEEESENEGELLRSALKYLGRP